MLIVLLIVVLAIGGTYFFFFSNNSTIGTGPLTCNNPYSYGRQSGWSFVCGDRSVSNGLLNITLNSYHFASGKDIQFEMDPSSVFLLANITVQNVGGGNAPIDAAWYVIFGNRSLASTTSSDQSVFGNQLLLQNATFPNTNPKQAFPVVNGGINLSPNQKLNCWLIFYVPNGALNINSSSVAQLYLLQLMYFQNGYGGHYQGAGSYICPCATVDTELIIIPHNS